MSLNRHISIATAALARGFLEPGDFLEAMRAIGRDGGGSVEAFWIEEGRLSREELEAVRRLIHAGEEGTGETLIVVRWPEGSERAEEGDLFQADTRLEVGDETARIQFRRLEPRVDAPPTRLESEPGEAAGDGPAPAPPGPPPAAPPVSRYELGPVLGTGGLGEVVEAADPRLGRSVALKMPRDHLREDQATRRILEREARIIASLEHPSIIPAYDAGNAAGLGPYYVMRRVSQPSLDLVLSRLYRADPEAKREYPLKRLLRDFIQICQAVDYAHSRGVIHCDLKPANVLLGEFGEVVIVDWGLAFSRDYPAGPRGGTPGFMAPEQLTRGATGIDARTDVFALGTILYQILCLAEPFPDVSRSESGEGGERDPLARYERPPAPSARAPELEVPEEAEAICMRAIELDPDRRFASAREMADALEEFLEGTAERERREAEADRLAASGDELADRYHELEENRPELLGDLERRRAETPPWAPVAEKEELWNAEDMLQVTDALRVRTMQAAVSSYEQALEQVANHSGARRGLARIYWAELQRARRNRNELDQIYFEQLIRHYDDGAHLEALGSEGRLTVEAREGVELSLCPLREQRRRLVRADEEPLDGNPPRARTLPPGRYIVEARRGDRRVSHPVLVLPGSEVRVEVDMSPAAELEPEEVLVPGGPALLGGPAALESGEPREVEVPSFAMHRFPVTFARFLEFVEHLRRSDEDAAARHLPSTPFGAPYWRYQGGVWKPAPAAGDVQREEMLRLPVFGVSATTAQAYAAWLSEQRGRELRLPSEQEWEKAARGVDGRNYPWGDHFDASFCKMRLSRPGSSRPEPPGAFERDESPYGVRDLGGGIADWTLPAAAREGGSPSVVSSRGGAWCDSAIACRAASRISYLADEQDDRVGFRLVRSVTL